MTGVSDDAAAGRGAVPAGAEPPEDDVVMLAGDQLLPEGVWLLVAGVEAAPGGVFTGVRLPAEKPRASGGDVVLRLAAGPGRLPSLPDGHVQVYAVMAGTLVLVGEWGIACAGDWSEVVRVTAAFTMGVLADLEERGADLRPHEAVDLETAVATAAVGLPAAVWAAPEMMP
jgi:hypothetical protein